MKEFKLFLILFPSQYFISRIVNPDIKEIYSVILCMFVSGLTLYFYDLMDYLKGK